jgi:hypothetical protein
MKYSIVFLLTFLLITSTLTAQDGANAKATVELSKTEILAGHSVTCSFVLENVQNARFTPPEWPKNVVVLAGPNQSSQIQVINGVVSSKITWTYRLSVKAAGKVVIPEAEFAEGEHIYRTEKQKIEVKPNPDGIEEVQEKPTARRYDFWGNPVPEPAPAQQPKRKRPTVRI